MVKEFKRQLKAKVAKMPRSSTRLQRCPPTPANLPPALLQDAYSADDPPVGQNQQLSAHLVQEMAQGTALRRTSRHIRQNMPLQASNASNTGAAMLATLGLGAPGVSLFSMLQCLQQQMQQGAMPQTQHGGMPQVNLPGFTWCQPSRTPAIPSSAPGDNACPAYPALPAPPAPAAPAAAAAAAAAAASAEPSLPVTSPARSACSEGAATLQGSPFQTEVADEDAEVLKQATAVSDALDEKKKPDSKSKKISDCFQKGVSSGKGRGKGKGKGKGKNAQPKVKSMPKSHPKAKAKPCAKSILKKPAAKGINMRDYYRGLSQSKRSELRPNGCQKCRQKPGCCPSCFA